MKILYVITSLRLGGAERLVTDLSKGLKESGHIVEIFTMDSTETPLTRELKECGIIIRTGWKGYLNMWNPFCYFKLRSLIKEEDYDIIHSHNSSAQFLTILAAPNHSGLVTTEHTTRNFKRIGPFFKYIDSFLYSTYKRIIAVSQTTKKSFLNHRPGLRLSEKTEVIYNGIDPDKFINKDMKTHLDKKEKIVIMVAGFKHPKDQKTLIKAMSLLPEHYILWLVGDGPTREEAEILTDELSLTSRVKFWGFRDDVNELLQSSDIFVLSSHYEGFGISLVEAMAASLPVIGSEVEGITEVMANTGVLFKEGDAKDLAEKIKEISENENLYSEISQKCKERSDYFNIKSTLSRHKELYEALKKV